MSDNSCDSDSDGNDGISFANRYPVNGKYASSQQMAAGDAWLHTIDSVDPSYPSLYDDMGTASSTSLENRHFPFQVDTQHRFQSETFHRKGHHRQTTQGVDRHRQEIQEMGADSSDLSLETLQSWSNLDNYPILVFNVSAKHQSLLQILEKSQLPAEWTCQLFAIFRNMTLAQSQELSVNRILVSVIDSKFFTSQLKSFLQQLRHSELYSQIFSILQNVFDVLDYILMNLPNSAPKCHSFLCTIKEGKNINILKEGNSLTVHFRHLLTKSEQKATGFPQHRKGRQNRNPDIPKPDDERPPQDFSQLTIFPDRSELEESYEPFLRANKTTGAYRNVRHYTDVHFRLLREDYLSPIRTGLKDYKNAIQQDTKVNSQELRFYKGVQLVKMKSNDKGMTFMVKFDNQDLKDINWELSRRFMFGALLCFSKDDFESVIFATVANRNTEAYAAGRVEVVFENNLEQVFTSSESDTFVIAETVSFFESYRHVLEGLQKIEELPLSPYIVHCEKQIRPPRYIDANTRFDFSPIMKQYVARKVNLLSPDDWPDSEKTLLNESQLEAVELSLTKELAIIQGPPGTGKTYVGLKIMELLLTNKKQMNTVNGPILVVCYTNHALDQFLEGILEFCRDGIVRVGGMSKSQALEKFNLTELTKNYRLNRLIRKSINEELSHSIRQLKQICHRIRSLWHESLQIDTTILTLPDLEEEVSHAHRISLMDESRSDGIESKVISQWMKASSAASVEGHIMEAAKRHLTKLIVGEGDVLEDTGLLSKLGVVRPDFETRARMYRFWVQELRKDLQQRLNIVFENQIKQREMIEISNDIQQQMADASKSILPDAVIRDFMTSSEVFESVQKCVEAECGEVFQSSYVESWLLGCFCKPEQILDAISRLSPKPLELGLKSKHYQDEFHAGSGWVIGNSDDEVDDDDDDDDDMGFDMRHEQDDSSEESPDEVSEEAFKFKMLEDDFKHTERKEIVLLQKAKLLGIDLEADKRSSEEWQTVNNMTYRKVFSLLHAKQPYSDEEASSIIDVWALSLPERYRLYKYWMLKKKEKIAYKIIDLTKDYKFYLDMKQAAFNKKKVAILKGARVIGMTTTGAAKNRKVLKNVAPRIIVVEEAAEVLEAHIITTLNRHCEHLILIGDHQQLRPNPTVHRLAVDYNFEISLFERLVKNKLPMVTLEVQHRMRPEVAGYLRLIYPNLVDHRTVLSYDDVKGVASNIFFLHHEFEERNVLDSTSKENIHEAEFLRELCKYFLYHGYSGDQITILAAYGGQVDILRSYMLTNDAYKDVKITSIDNYQGEENDIILLSLVRSNITEEVGFLKSKNRVCVALSRARKGLFVIGNLKLLAGQSKLWKQIVDRARRSQVFGSALKLPCVNHNGHYSLVRSVEDFQTKAPEGGCDRPCNAELGCGHICPRMCHASDRDHQEQMCHQACLLSCVEGHPCQKLCYQDCGLCEVLVEKTLTLCGHKDLVPCHRDELTAVCHQPCRQRLSCGHACNGFCGECLKSDVHSPCTVEVQHQWPCSHTNTAPCNTDVKVTPCPSKCTSLLDCGHRCHGSCGECLNGRVHRICSHRCKKMLPCGHQCSGKCGVQCAPCPLRCPFLCRHSRCSKSTCGEPCDVCMENCTQVCKHQQCHKRCSDDCARAPCKRKCSRRTKCQHACVSLCGEECVCFNCDLGKFVLLDFSKKKTGKAIPQASKERASKFQLDSDTLLMKIPGCEHVFTLSQLDQFVNSIDPDSSHYIQCPIADCSHTLQEIVRYNSRNKSCTLKRENRKADIKASFNVTDRELDELAQEVELNDYQQEHFDQNRLKSLKCQIMFATVLNKIEKMHKRFNGTKDLNFSKWRNSILSIETRVTAQFIEELTMEFHRLLIAEQIAALRIMINDAGLTLDEPLRRQCKVKKQLQQRLNASVKEMTEALIEELYKIIFAFKGDARIERNSKEMLAMSKDVKSHLSQLCVLQQRVKDAC